MRRPYQYHIEVFDGSGQLVHVDDMGFVSTSSSRNTWTSYRPKRSVDAPGEWRFQVFLDRERMIDATVRVTRSIMQRPPRKRSSGHREKFESKEATKAAYE